MDICAFCYVLSFAFWSKRLVAIGLKLNEHGIMVSTFKTCKAHSALLCVRLRTKEKAKGEFSFVLVEPLLFLNSTVLLLSTSVPRKVYATFYAEWRGEVYPIDVFVTFD